jgi:ABC-type transporter Mla subunit MlaD
LVEENTKVENNTPTAEDYAALKAELEAERTKATGLVEQATAELQGKVTNLEAEVSTKTQDIEALKGQLSEVSTNFEGAKAAYAYAVEDFKKLASASNPLIPPEVIFGTTVEEVKASLARTNKLVANVQESLAKQAVASVVPAGAPQRTGPNVEGMSTKEKINLGLEQARKQKEQ